MVSCGIHIDIYTVACEIELSIIAISNVAFWAPNLKYYGGILGRRNCPSTFKGTWVSVVSRSRYSAANSTCPVSAPLASNLNLLLVRFLLLRGFLFCVNKSESQSLWKIQSTRNKNSLVWKTSGREMGETNCKLSTIATPKNQKFKFSVVCADGSYYKFSFDPKKGECTRQTYSLFLEMTDWYHFGMVFVHRLPCYSFFDHRSY